MKRDILKKFGLLGFIGLIAFICIPHNINAQFVDEKALPFERGLLPPEREEQQTPQYVEGEVLVKFKEGIEPQTVLQGINLEAASTERVHSIKPVVSKFKKDYKLEKDSDGWYWFKGKNYKEVEGIPDEDIFQEASQQMSALRKGLYRNYKITLAEGENVEDAVERLRGNPDIEYAYPNYIRQAYAIPNDPRFSEQWALPKINAPEAWDITEGSSGIVIAIIDTGVDYNHEDLTSNIWINEGEIPNNGLDDDINGYIDDDKGWDFVSVPSSYVADGEDPGPRDNDPMDVHGHGTHCSGIAAAVTNNGIGIAGVAPNCKIMAVRAGYKISDGRGSLIDFDIEQAILYAIDNGAKVISMSFGGYYQGAYLDEVETAYQEGVVLVAAAGNDNTSDKLYPAAMDEVIAVVATQGNDTKASFSNYGDWIDVAAPGVVILSTLPNNEYAKWNGTSMACPHVAGIAALILAKNPLLANEEVRQRIQFLSDDIGEPGKDTYFGYGRVNAYMAVAVDDFGCSVTSPSDQGYIRGTIDILGSAFIDSIEEGFQRYELHYAPKDEPQSTTLITSSPSCVQQGLLGVWDTTGCSEGEYFLILKIITTADREITYSINVTIDNINQPPEFLNLTNKGAVIDRLFEYKVEAQDPDEPGIAWGQLEYSAYNLPQGAQFDPQTQIFSWLPTESDKGIYEVTFTVRDNEHTVTENIAFTTVVIEETRITTDPADQYSPDFYKDKIVWMDYRNGNLDIYMYNLTTGQETQITTDPSRHLQPAIYENKIVWQDNRNGNEDIYMYNLTTSQETQITTDPSDQFQPAIYENKIVWHDWRHREIRDADIYMYDLLTEQEIQITTNSGLEVIPDIYEDKIIWMDSQIGDWNIYMYDLATNQETQITDDPNSQIEPAIYQDRIVWRDSRNGNYDIYMYDLTTSQETPITTDPRVQWSPAIYQDKIVWYDGRNGNYDIYMHAYDSSTGELGPEIQITTSPNTQSYPAIYQDRIVWEDDRNGNGDIYMARVFFVPQVTSVSPVEVFPGEMLTITGKNFGYTQEDSQVRLSGALCSIETWSDTGITCRVTNVAQTGLLRVITQGGESNGVMVTIADFSITASPSQVTPGQSITVSWGSLPDKVSSTDWIGLYEQGDSNENPLAWKWTGGSASGSLAFSAPDTPGNYEFRYLLKGNFTDAARSNLVSVGGFSITASPSQVTPGQSITVSWSALPDEVSSTDWIGLYEQGAPNGSVVAWKWTGGSASGSLTFSAPDTPDNYEFRYLLKGNFTDVARSNLVSVGGFSITASPSQVTPGQSITVSWSALPDEVSSTDWIALYVQGAPNGSYLAWKYTGGSASGSLTFIAPDTPGNYEFRYLPNDGYTDAAHSNLVSVGGFSITASPSQVTPGQTITVTWSALPDEVSDTDWIGLYTQGDSNENPLAWDWTGGSASGGLTFSAPATPGNYELRYLLKGNFTDVARSNLVSVGGFSITASPSQVTPGQTITVTWSALPDEVSSTDWIGLYEQGAPNGSIIAWNWTGGSASGSLTFSAPATPGNYELRYLLKGNFTDVARSNLVSVGDFSITASPSQVTPGQTITVTWSAPANQVSSTDWICLYKQGASNQEWDPPGLWRYTNGAASGSLTFSAPATPGNYEFRYLPNNGYTDVARSNLVSVTDDSIPIVSITDPQDGETVQRKSTITISAQATDNIGVTKVEFYINAQLHSTDYSPAYQSSWKVPARDGRSYQLRARAYDAKGNMGSSIIITVISGDTSSGGDTTPPSVSLTAPGDGVTVSGTSVTISASASDDVGVEKVEFYRDGGILLGTDTTAPYSINWNSTTVANGSHSIYAKATDTSANTANSNTHTVTVQNGGSGDTTPPSVWLSGPADGATVSGTSVHVSATASDNVGVEKVEFYRDGGILLGTDFTAIFKIYAIYWDSTTVADGSHTIYAKAIDTSGNSTNSSSRTVTVQNGGGGDTTPPTVTITAPQDGAQVARRSTITISANANDNVAVSRVEFSVNGALINSDATAPYSCSWKAGGKPGASHTIKATAYDAAGNNSTDTITVTSLK